MTTDFRGGRRTFLGLGCVAASLLVLTGCGGGSKSSPPPAPTASITANPVSVARNAASQLNWTSTNATTCTASGGWSGSQATSGSASTGALTATATFALTCSGSGGTATGSATVTVLNAAPTANAGPDQTVLSGGLVTLTGAASSDHDGAIAGYAWTQTSGPAVTLSSTTAQRPTFTAPIAGVATALVFSLTVTDDSGAASAAADTVTVTVQAGTTVSGRITFDRIPFRTPPGLGLEYAAMRQDPARGLLVEVIRVDPPFDPVLVTTTTDADGRYSAAVPPNIQVAVRVFAEMTRAAPLPPPHWRFRVRDIDANFSFVAGPPGVVTGAAGSATQLDYNIPAGWTTAGFPAPVPMRRAAPFAILDTVYTIITKIQQVEPTIVFPELVVDWAESNPGGETFYDPDGGGPNRRISLSAEPNVDTEEYDPHVIAHEFGHYLEDRFARSDSIGGSHGAGDRLDMRVALGEGFGYAFAGMMLDTPLIRDSIGANQAQESFFNIESDPVSFPGWYSEASVHHVLWDLYDTVPDANDAVALGFAPLWQILTGAQRTTDAMTSIFSFVTPLKQANAGQAAAINTIVAGQSMVSATMNVFGATETNNAGSAHVLPVYTPIGIGTGAQTVSSIQQFGGVNGLSVHRFLTLTVPGAAPASVRITVTGPAGRDPDIIVWRRGVFVTVSQEIGDEDFTLPIGAAGTVYVLDVYDYDFTQDTAAGAGTTPITVTVTQ